MSSSFPQYILKEATSLKLDYSPLCAVPSSSYSSIMPQHFDQAAKIFEKYGLTPSRILDATANIGGDTILMSYLYPEADIDAVEPDDKTFECLKKNTLPSVIGKVLALRRETLGTGLVTPHHASCLPFLDNLFKYGQTYDLVYFDPPWGGPDYYKQKNLVMSLDNDPVSRLAGRVLRFIAPVVVIKGPVNTDVSELESGIQAELGFKPAIQSFEILKPVANAKGTIAYRLWFFTRTSLPLTLEPESTPEPKTESSKRTHRSANP